MSGSTSDSARFVLGCATIEPGSGGIAKVARMSARSLIEAGYRTSVHSFLDEAAYPLAGQRARPAAGSRLKFAAGIAASALRQAQFVYDSVGMARAHPALLDRGNGYTLWMHGIEAWEKLRPEHERAFRKAKRVLVNSHNTLRRFEELHGPLPQAVVCPLATEEDETAMLPLRDAGSPPTALILSRIDTSEGYKGHPELLAAWPRVMAAVPDARLVVVGGGNGREAFAAQVREAGLAANIEVEGFVPDEALPRHWAAADLFVMPSRGEGFGLVYIEAMRHGLPVIASIHDAGKEVNAHGVTGLNVDMDRSGDLGESLIALLENRDRARAMGEAGLKRWRAHFRHSAFARRFLAALDLPQG